MSRRWKFAVYAIILCGGIIIGMIAGMSRKKEAAAEYVFYYADNQTEDYPTVQGAERFAELVKEQTQGRIHILVRSGAKLGSEGEVLEQLGYGGIAFARISVAQIAGQVSELNVLQMPYLYRDSEHMWKVLEGEIGDYFMKQVERCGYIGLSWYDAGARSFYSAGRPITCLEDFQGLSIRVQESDMMADMVEALGARAVKIKYSNVYSELQQHSVDGAENNWPSYEAMKHYEVAPYFTEDEHSRIPELQMCSAYVWDRLSDEDRKIILQCAQESAEYERMLWKQREEEAKQAAVEQGVEVISLTPEEKEKFRNAMSDVYDKYCKGSEAIIQQIIEQ